MIRLILIALCLSFSAFVVAETGSKADKKNTTSEKACGSKRTCKQMSSCDEALHYLKQCKVKSLDRDKDGIPCESICGNRRK